MKNNWISILKRTHIKAGLVFAVLLLPILVVTPMVYASGDASFALSPASGSYTTGGAVTVTVYASAAAGDNANAVQANLSFSGLTNPQVDINTGIFAFCIPPYSGSYVSGNTIRIPCATTSTFSGTVTVATINFTAGSAGSASVSMQSGSDIQAAGTSVFNGTFPSASYMLKAQQPSGSGGSGGAGGTGSTGGSSGTKRGSGGGAKSSTSSPIKTLSPTSGSPGSATPTNTITHPSTSITPTTNTQTSVASAILKISVTDGKGKPVPNAKVSIDEHYTAYTNAQGKAEFSNLMKGSHKVAVTAPGKTTARTTLLLGGHEKQVALKLASSTSPILTASYALVGLIILSSGAYMYVRHSRRGLFDPALPTSGIVTGSNVAPVVHVDAMKPDPASKQGATTTSAPKATAVHPSLVAAPTPSPTSASPTTPSNDGSVIHSEVPKRPYLK